VKIVQIETLRLDEFPNLLFVEIHTDEGFVGLGETFFGAQTVETDVHERIAPLLLGKEALRIDGHAIALAAYVGYSGTGAEQRANSAIDIALWDILGQSSGQPIFQLLGGAFRETVRVYNTCAGPSYIRRDRGQVIDNWGVSLDSPSPREGYEDLIGFLTDAGELARDLLAEGITAMKVWPFDPYVEPSGGLHIRAGDLELALEPFRQIRRAVGSRMEIMAELHGLWNAPTARRIIRALEEFDPLWVEDPVRADNVRALGEIGRTTAVSIAVGETLAGRRAYRDVLDQGAAGTLIIDPGWSGGISEAKKIATLAETYDVPVAIHDCTGPVALAAATHLSINLPNVAVQETVRAFYGGWYRELVTNLPEVHDGYIRPLAGPGLGTVLRREVKQRQDAHVRVSHAYRRAKVALGDR
jgi:L-alanine-DL-glutamate epimerase-like enolase superfamily enzyme